MFTVKGNQPTLQAEIAAKFDDPSTATCTVTTRNIAHGRIEIRTLTVCSGNGVNWPGCQQVCRIDRLRCDIKTDKVTVETVYAVASLSAEEASAKALLQLNQGHWSIENQLHYVRDVTMKEDASQVSKGSGPRVMATIRNTVIGILHRNGIRTIAATLRDLAADVGSALAMIGIRWAPH